MKDLCLLKEANVMFMKFIKYLNIVLIAIVLILFIFLVIPKLNAEELSDYPTPHPVSQLNGNEIAENQQTVENPNLGDEYKKKIWSKLDQEEMDYEDVPTENLESDDSYSDYLIDLGDIKNYNKNSFAYGLKIVVGEWITEDMTKQLMNLNYDYGTPINFNFSYKVRSDKELPILVYLVSEDGSDNAIFYPSPAGSVCSEATVAAIEGTEIDPADLVECRFDYNLSFYKGVKPNTKYTMLFYVFPGSSKKIELLFTSSPVKAFPANTENLLEKIMSINKDLEIADSMTVDNIAQITDIPSSNLQTVKEALDNADIDAEDIVGSISLTTDENGNPYYVVTKMQEKKFLGIIPIGNEQVVEKINAIKSEEQ